MSSNNKDECPGKKPREPPQTRACLESMPLTRPLITSSSRQCVIRVTRANKAPDDSPSQNDIKFCTSETCRNSASCLKTLPQYCPYGKKDDSDTSVCPGRCSHHDDDNDLNVVDYRQSMKSLADSMVKSFQNLTDGCAAALNSSPADCNVQKGFPTSTSKEPHAHTVSSKMENELPPRKASCCPDIDSDSEDAIARETSQEHICPSVKSYLDKQTSTQEFLKPDVATTQRESVSKGILFKEHGKATKSNQATTTEVPTSVTPTCPAVSSALKLLSELPCSAQHEQNSERTAEKRSSLSRAQSLKLASVERRSRDSDAELQNGRVSLIAKKNELSQVENRAQCCPREKTKEVDPMRPCSVENFPCCQNSTSKSANVLSQENTSKTFLGCGKSTCGMTICGPKPEANLKCTSTNQPHSTTQTPSPQFKTGKKQLQNVGSSGNCTSALCPGNEERIQCNCRYPPAFRQFGCMGNIAGNCDCASKDT